MALGHGKLEYLNSIEKPVLVETNVDTKCEKYFITFPYPYMNGKLHLGHLYSFSKADFTAYYKNQCGYNVLLPFGFHCTGMPISASASKLKEELAGNKVDVSVVGILSSLGIEDPKPFTDPLHWIRTFPEQAKNTLLDYHAFIDWRRSFITTDINPYYDSFVRYQFNSLKAAGRISFGKRYSIFCTIDQQPCLDHDRRRGEGVKPVEVILFKVCFGEFILLVRCNKQCNIRAVVISRNKKLVKFKSLGKEYVIEEELYENLKYQIGDSHFIEKVVLNEETCIIDGLERQGISEECKRNKEYSVKFIDEEISPRLVYEIVEGSSMDRVTEGSLVNKEHIEDSPVKKEYEEIINRKNEQMLLIESKNYIKMYEPNGEVISRSGSHCVVSLLDQWFLNYGDSRWKSEVRECIDNMELTGETRSKLNDAVSWIDKWGCSRSFGLGTRLPWDTQYLIDSLSDSTIYMAFYTVNHFLFRDLEGKEEIFPADLMNDTIWEYILTDKCTRKRLAENGLKEDLIKILDDCKESFRYFYPVDLRVSAKDLISNHLIFFIFNHVALFDRKYWPKRIFTNGYALLNSAKMSKSEGNFLSAEESLKKYGASATRMCLALCGDTNEDANFEESTANSLILKLYTLAKSIEALDFCSTEKIDDAVKDALSHVPNSLNRLVDLVLLEELSRSVRLVNIAYENMLFRDVVKYGFYDSLHSVDKYINSYNGENDALIAYAYMTILQMIYPIVPSLSSSLLSNKFEGKLTVAKEVVSTFVNADAVEHVDVICSRITKAKRANHKKVVICTWPRFPEWKIQCMEVVDRLRGKEGDERSIKQSILTGTQPIIAKSGSNKNKSILFVMDYYKNSEAYKFEFDEYLTLLLLRQYIEGITGLEVGVIKGEEGEPLAPFLRFE